MLDKITHLGKKTTTILLILVFVIGVVGSFDRVGLNMDSYVKFLDKFIWILGTMTVSVGAGTIVKNIKNDKPEAK